MSNRCSTQALDFLEDRTLDLYSVCEVFPKTTVAVCGLSVEVYRDKAKRFARAGEVVSFVKSKNTASITVANRLWLFQYIYIN